jgi:hypothetical protein
VTLRWSTPELLPLAVLLPLALLLAILLAWRRRRDVAAAIPGAAPGIAAFPGARAALLLPAAALLGVAAAGPVRGLQGPPAAGEVVLLLDASNSMLVQDVPPSRMELQRALALELLDRLAPARVGLVAFAGGARVLAPRTADHAVLATYLEDLSPEAVRQGGTALSAALRAGLALLDDGRGPAGSLVLLSDGEALEDGEVVDEAVGRVARAGVAVHTVGIGTRAGGPVPHLDPVTGESSGYKEEPGGQPAVSRLDAETLRRIAARTGGTARLASDPGAVAALADALSAGGGAGRPWRGYRWPLLASLGLLALDALAAGRGRGRVPR